MAEIIVTGTRQGGMQAAESPVPIQIISRNALQLAAAVAEGKGIVVVDGRLVENLHVLNARRIVDLAAAIVELEARG